MSEYDLYRYYDSLEQDDELEEINQLMLEDDKQKLEEDYEASKGF